MWVGQTVASTAEHSAARSDRCSDASTAVMSVGEMDALLVVRMAVCWVDRLVDLKDMRWDLIPVVTMAVL